MCNDRRAGLLWKSRWLFECVEDAKRQKTPLVVASLLQVLFPWRANGSIIVRHGQPVGSELIGQPFDEPHPRAVGRTTCERPGSQPGPRSAMMAHLRCIDL